MITKRSSSASRASSLRKMSGTKRGTFVERLMKRGAKVTGNGMPYARAADAQAKAPPSTIDAAPAVVLSPAVNVPKRRNKSKSKASQKKQATKPILPAQRPPPPPPSSAALGGNTMPIIGSEDINNIEGDNFVELTFPNGNHYRGEWRKGKMHGRGEYTFKDGSKYVGTFDDGELSGVGVKTWGEDNNESYKGQWARGLFHGRGEIVSANGDIYKGEFRNGMFHGSGKRVWATGDLYDGKWRDGMQNGRGTLRRAADGFIYRGDWHEGLMHGDGDASWAEGHRKDSEAITGVAWKRYVGEFREDDRLGNGMLEMNNGIIYKGYFVRGGCVSGQMILPDLSVYEGEMKNGYPEGRGTAHWKDGTSFEGEWSGGAPCGLGERSGIGGEEGVTGCFGEGGWCSGPGTRVFVVAAGDERLSGLGMDDGAAQTFRYSGDLRDNRMHGKGTLAWPNGARTYEGEFYEDKIVGQGKLTWAVQSLPAGGNGAGGAAKRSSPRTGGKRRKNTTPRRKPEQEKKTNTYSGTFLDGVFHGHGKLVFFNGVEYTGSFRDGKYHGVGKIDMTATEQGQYSGQWSHGAIVGQGTRIWPTGDVYIGEWDATSRMHGRGSFVWHDGSQYVGEFQRGRRSGNGKQIWHSGHYYIGQWRRGHPHGKGILVNPNDEEPSQTIGLWEKGNLVKELIMSNSAEVGKHEQGKHKFIGIRY